MVPHLCLLCWTTTDPKVQQPGPSCQRQPENLVSNAYFGLPCIPVSAPDNCSHLFPGVHGLYLKVGKCGHCKLKNSLHLSKLKAIFKMKRHFVYSQCTHFPALPLHTSLDIIFDVNPMSLAVISNLYSNISQISLCNISIIESAWEDKLDTKLSDVTGWFIFSDMQFSVSTIHSPI